MLATCSEVASSPLPNVMLYVNPNACGQAAFVAASSMLSDNPKSSFTLASAPLVPIENDSDDVLPRYSQREERAKPCCGSLEVGAWEEEGGPKSYYFSQEKESC